MLFITYNECTGSLSVNVDTSQTYTEIEILYEATDIKFENIENITKYFYEHLHL